MSEPYQKRHAQVKEGGLFYKFNVDEMKVKNIRRSKFRGIRLERDQEIKEALLQ